MLLQLRPGEELLRTADGNCHRDWKTGILVQSIWPDGKDVRSVWKILLGYKKLGEYDTDYRGL